MHGQKAVGQSHPLQTILLHPAVDILNLILLVGSPPPRPFSQIIAVQNRSPNINLSLQKLHCQNIIYAIKTQHKALNTSRIRGSPPFPSQHYFATCHKNDGERSLFPITLPPIVQATPTITAALRICTKLALRVLWIHSLMTLHYCGIL